MARVSYGLADADQHPIIAALHDFICHHPSIWLEWPSGVGHESRRRGRQRSADTRRLAERSEAT
jgi:hypothetical protein